MRKVGKLILKMHFIEQFQSGFNVCTVWTAENSGKKIHCGLRGILVVSA